MFDQLHSLVTSSLQFLSLDEAVRQIGRLVSHDYQTFTHSVHVFTYSMSIMSKGHLEESELIDAGIGALLHDIGKTRVPRRILQKPGRLEPDEWEVVKGHPVLGLSLCSSITLDHTTINCILFHHEKFDGSGYPSGMEGRDIPWPVRVITVCDVYDAITSKRPYAEAETPFSALSIMKREMSGALDMDVFKHLVRLLSQEAQQDLSIRS
jgi:putative nucleotidyltransferase with HDIG domain